MDGAFNFVAEGKLLYQLVVVLGDLFDLLCSLYFDWLFDIAAKTEESEPMPSCDGPEKHVEPKRGRHRPWGKPPMLATDPSLRLLNAQSCLI